MKLTLQQHQNRISKMPNPEARIAYFLKNAPNKTIALSTAENVLLCDFFKENAFQCQDRKEITSKDFAYGTPYGSDPYRESMCKLLSDSWGIQNLDPENLYFVGGTSAALECLAFALFQPGDIAITPAPIWYGFPWCFDQRPKMKLEPFQLIDGGIGNFRLTLGDVKRAYKEHADQGQAPKVLVLTNPNNPLGVNYSKKTLEEIYTWVLTETKMHIISDEIYAFSQTQSATDPAFASAYTLRRPTQAKSTSSECI